jgi:regulator of sirC expression with transglutaminase-like and TPR domain
MDMNALGSRIDYPVSFPATFKRLLLALFTLVCFTSSSSAASTTHPAESVQAALAIPGEQLDYGRTKLALDQIIDRSIDVRSVEKELRALIDAARKLSGNRASDGAKIDAVRKVLYEPGPWNGNRPFTYDQSDPLGENVQHKLLSHYLKTRLGNCVTMPTLFMIVGRGIGLNLTLTTAPLHVLVRYTHAGLPPLNIEATSGGSFARTEWIRKNLPMSDRAIESGLYLRTHTDREIVAVMATTVLDYLAGVGRNEEAIKVADAILAANPKDGYTMVRKGSVIAAMMQKEFYSQYLAPAMIRKHLRPRYAELAAANAKAFEDAEALGWEPSK